MEARYGPAENGKSLESTAFSPDGLLVATSEFVGKLRIWNRQNGEMINELTPAASSSFLAFSPDGQILAAGTAGSARVELYTADGSSSIRTLQDTGSQLAMAFFPDGSRIVGVGDKIRVWNVQTGQIVLNVPQAVNKNSVAVSPDGTWIVTSAENGQVDRTHAETGATNGWNFGQALAVDFAPQGSHILVSKPGIPPSPGEVLLVPFGSSTATLVIPGGVGLFSHDGTGIVARFSDLQTAVWSSGLAPPPDSDGDGIHDPRDMCPNTIPGVTVDFLGCPPLITADLDRDGDVDAEDFETFQMCISGPEMTQNDPDCLSARLDDDEDVDLVDFGILQRCFSGSEQPADPSCTD
jgi:hypothetical protein